MKKIMVQLHSGRTASITGEDIEVVEISNHIVVANSDGDVVFDAHEGNIEYYTCEVVDG